MFSPIRISSICLASLVLALAALCPPAKAQSGSSSQPRYAQPRYSPAPQPSRAAGSGTATGSAAKAEETPLALRGYCTVCLAEMRKWNRGNERFQTVYDGRLYYFPGQEQLDMFLANPVKYVPTLAGDCVVHYAQTGERVAGDLAIGSVHKGRLFFFASQQHRDAFRADPAAYENVDLAMGGECAVCRLEMGRQMPGDSELTVIHHGMRYRFAGENQRAAFASDPDRYAEASRSSSRMQTSGSGSTTVPARQPSGSGTQPSGGSSAGR